MDKYLIGEIGKYMKLKKLKYVNHISKGINESLKYTVRQKIKEKTPKELCIYLRNHTTYYRRHKYFRIEL